MERVITVMNRKSVQVTYEIKDDHVSPPQNNRTLATGTLASGASRQHTVNTYSESPGDSHYYYNYMRIDDGVWHGWTGAWTNNGILELI